MKLEGTLPKRVGLLHAMPLFDLSVLFLVTIFVGPLFFSQAGVEVELPISQYRLAHHVDAAVITITPGEPPVFWLGRERLTRDELRARLKTRREESARVPMVYVRADRRVASGVDRVVAELALAEGFRVYLIGEPAGES